MTVPLNNADDGHSTGADDLYILPAARRKLRLEGQEVEDVERIVTVEVAEAVACAKMLPRPLLFCFDIDIPSARPKRPGAPATPPGPDPLWPQSPSGCGSA